MKILFSHLKKYLKEDIDISGISDSLFKLGHENEHDKKIIDIEFTPNKGDCLSVYGLARDLNSIHEIDLQTKIYEGSIEELDFNFKNHEIDFCPKIKFLKIEIESRPDKYKPYLENYFDELKITKNNFFTDVSNYLSYEIGQPTHCYDFNKVKDGITLTSLKKDSTFKTLLDKEIKLVAGEKVFKSAEEIINFAGVMGGQNSKCNDFTNTALVECAFFNPDVIIGKSVKYDLVSDAAYKFERGADINIHEFALRRFIQIVNDHTNIKSIAIKSEVSHEYKNKKIQKDHKKINKILGTDLKEYQINEILENLGFQVNRSYVTPSWRTDIESINDIAEEVARVIGYDEIMITNLKVLKKPNTINLNSKVNKIRNYLVNKGFNEVINDPFIQKNESRSVKVDNPLDSNRSFLRLNLIDSLVKNLDYNEKRQKEVIKFFEISDIYSYHEEDKKVISKKYLSVIISGRKGLNYLDFNKKLDKKYLNDVISNLGLDQHHIQELDRASLDSKIKNKIFYIDCDMSEIDYSLLTKNLLTNHKFLFNKATSISDLPASQRDISISLNNEKILKETVDTVFKINLLNLKDLFIFDFYHNKDKNIIKVGFRFIFQSKIKTLQDNDIDNEMKKIFNALSKIDGISIPGLNLH